MDNPTPERIMQLGLGFWASRTLLTAIEPGVFSELANGALDAKTLTERVGLVMGLNMLIETPPGGFDYSAADASYLSKRLTYWL